MRPRPKSLVILLILAWSLALHAGPKTKSSIPELEGNLSRQGLVEAGADVRKSELEVEKPKETAPKTEDGDHKIYPRSNLLFPFIVNGSGYETGIAITNTTKDPWMEKWKLRSKCSEEDQKKVDEFSAKTGPKVGFFALDIGEDGCLHMNPIKLGVQENKNKAIPATIKFEEVKQKTQDHTLPNKKWTLGQAAVAFLVSLTVCLALLYKR